MAKGKRILSRRTRKKIKRGLLRAAKHWITRDIVTVILMLAIFYLGAMGIMMVALNTDAPMMAVISPSMVHGDESWRSYFENEALRQETFKTSGLLNLAENVDTFDTSKFPIQAGFARGDMLIIQGVSSPADVAVGDVIIVDQGPGVVPLVHRVYKIWNEGTEVRFTTKGDNNQRILTHGTDERAHKPGQIKGKVVFVVPWIGWLSLWWQGT